MVWAHCVRMPKSLELAMQSEVVRHEAATIQKRDWTVKKIQKFSSLKAGAAPVVLGLALLAAPAFAQTAEEDVATDEIIVTGTLISNPNLDRSSPVLATTADQIELKQNNTVHDPCRRNREDVSRCRPGACT